MNEESPILRAGSLWFPVEALQFAMSRSSGPGGQNVNKLNTRVEVRLPLSSISGLSEPITQRLAMLAGKRLMASGTLRIICQMTRSQEANRETAIRLLLELMEDASHLPKKRHATRPTRGSRRRRIEDKKHRGEAKVSRRAPTE